MTIALKCASSSTSWLALSAPAADCCPPPSPPAAAVLPPMFSPLSAIPLALLFLLLLLPRLSMSSPVPAAPPVLAPVQFSCRRFHPSFCCSSRVRQSCAHLCVASNSSPCIAPFTDHQPFQGPIPPSIPPLPSSTSFGGSIDSAASANRPFAGLGPVGPALPPLIIAPPPSAAGESQRRRFTTEGEYRGFGGSWSRPPDPNTAGGGGPLPPLRPNSPSPPPPFGLVLPPPDSPSALGTPVPIDDLDGEQHSLGNNSPGQTAPEGIDSKTEVEPALPDEEGQFPTLLPPGPDVQPSIDEFGGMSGNGKVMGRTEGGAIDGIASASKGTAVGNASKGQKRRGGGGTALKPPDLMRELEELEGGGEPSSAEASVGEEKGQPQQQQQQQWWTPIRLSLVQEASQPQARTTVPEDQGPSATGSPSAHFSNQAPSLSDGKFWSVRIKPTVVGGGNNELKRNGSGEAREGEEVVERRKDLPMPMAGQEQAPQKGAGLFGDKIDVVVDRLFTGDLINSIAAIAGARATNSSNSRHKLKAGGKAAAKFTEPQSSFSNITTSSPPPFPSTVPATKCGTSPEFVPCVPLDQANSILLSCCRKKQMPSGCLPLCRYDTTQAQVKMAFDKGQCGILNVAPFLECASQGQDNRDCCRHKQIAQRSGTQCEVFCHPSGGLGLLGLQHLLCNSVLQSMLECHHSGLKSS